MGKCCCGSRIKQEKMEEHTVDHIKVKEPKKNEFKDKKIEDYNQENCPICSDLYSNDKPIKKLICGHFFCKICIDSAIEIHPFCPICRSHVDPETSVDEETNELEGNTWNLNIIRTILNKRGNRNKKNISQEKINNYSFSEDLINQPSIDDRLKNALDNDPFFKRNFEFFLNKDSFKMMKNNNALKQDPCFNDDVFKNDPFFQNKEKS